MTASKRLGRPGPELMTVDTHRLPPVRSRMRGRALPIGDAKIIDAPDNDDRPGANLAKVIPEPAAEKILCSQADQLRSEAMKPIGTLGANIHMIMMSATGNRPYTHASGKVSQVIPRDAPRDRETSKLFTSKNATQKSV